MTNYFVTFFRKIKLTWKKDLQITSKVLLFIIIAQTLAIISIGISTLVLTQSCYDSSGMIIECNMRIITNEAVTLFLWSFFFLASMFIGIFFGNLFELYGCMFLSLLLTADAIYRFMEPYTNSAINCAFLVLTCAPQVFYFGIGFWLYKEYSVRTYHKIGADTKFQSLYRLFLIWKAILRLNIVFALIATTNSGSGIFDTGWRAGLDWATYVVILVVFFLGYYGVKNENWQLIIPFLILFPLLPASLIVMFIDLWVWSYNAQSYSWFVQAKLFNASGSVSLVLNIILLFLTIPVLCNFGKGIKNLGYLQQKKEVSEGVVTDKSTDEQTYMEYSEEVSSVTEDLSIKDVIRATEANRQAEKKKQKIHKVEK